MQGEIWRGGAKLYEGDLPVRSVEWCAPPMRRDGVARIELPRDHEAVQAGALDERGGFRVRLFPEALGAWDGYVRGPLRASGRGVSAVAYQRTSLTRGEPVLGGDTLRGLPAGLIAEVAVTRVAAASAGLIRAGTFCYAGPAIPEWRMDGRSLAQMLDELQSASLGQEWTMDGDGCVSWRAAVAPLYPSILTADGDITFLDERQDEGEMARAVIAVDRDGRETPPIRADDLAGRTDLPIVRITPDVSSFAALMDAAVAELEARRHPAVAYTVGLHRGTPGASTITAAHAASAGRLARKLPQEWVGGALDHWRGIREGMRVVLALPLAGAAGRYVLGRVLQRTAGDWMPHVELTVQAIRPLDAATVALAGVRAAARYARPEWTPLAPARDAPVTPARVSTTTIDGLIESAQVRELAGAKVTGQVASASLADRATLAVDATNAAAAASVPASGVGNGALPAGVTVTPAQVSGVTVTAGDLNKTGVAAWEAGATKNVQQGAQASPATKSAETIAFAATAADAADKASVQTAVDNLRTWMNTEMKLRFDELLTKLGNAGAKVIG